MRPFYPNQQKPQPRPPPSGFPTRQVTDNPNNLIQMQSQAGYMNPQVSNPVNFHNPNVGAVDVLQLLQGLMNLANQNGHMGNANLGSGPPVMHPMQTHQEFGQPNLNFNLNALSGILGQLRCLPGNFNGLNLSQCLGQSNALNQNGGYQNGQFGFQNHLQNATQLGNLGLPTPPQAATAAPFGPRMMPSANQAAPQGMVPPSNVFVSSLQFGHMHVSSSPLQKNLPQHNLASSVMNANAFNQQPASQIRGNSPSPSQAAPYGPRMMPCANQVASHGIGPPSNAFVASQQSGHMQTGGNLMQKNLPQHNIVSSVMNANAFNQQPASQIRGNSPSPSVSASSITQQKGNFGKRDGTHTLFLGRNKKKGFRPHPKHEVPNQRSHTSQNDRLHNARGNRCLSNQNGRRGASYDGGRASGLGNSASPSKAGKPRALAVPYTDREILQWREERKRHYPTEFNIKKVTLLKLANKQTNAGTKSNDKLWRQQLKDVLAKQVELGFEVPEISPHYLSDSDEWAFQHEQEGKPFNKNKFQHSNNKLGRFKRHKQFGGKPDLAEKRPYGKHQPSLKRKRFENDYRSHSAPALREPTLLQKLLSADIKQEKSHLLQAFRFMVMNSFFKDWPETPLKFPQVIVNEAGSVSEVIERTDSPLEEAGLMEDGSVGVDGHNDIDDGDDNMNQNENESGSFGRKGRNHQER
ncbi:hypothetical protein AKJ16_DCAP16167 [Drosera capensis]